MNDFKLNETQKIKPGFTAPDAYFEAFTERLMQQLPQQQPVKVVPLYRRRPVWLSAAAAFVVMFTVGLFFITNSASATQPDDAAIENYLVYNSNASAYEIGQHLDDQDIKELEASLAISDDAVQDYLSEDNIYTYE